jgi:hypothetical protein
VDQTDLTSHIPAPAAGKAPVSFLLDPQYAGRVQWRADGIPAEGAFKPLTAYEAVVTLIAVSGYTFTGLPANAFSHTGALSVSSEADSGAVTISFEATGTIAVENYNLQDYVPVPAAGERAVKAVDRNDLGIKVVWKAGETDITNDLDLFVLGVAYQAEITLEAKSGYAFDQPFAYPAGTISSLSGGSTDAGSRMLTVTYKQTQAPAAVTESNLTPYIPAPVTGATGIGYFNAPQYGGTVAWTKTGETNLHTGPFAADTAYTATVTLNPAAGYTLNGLNTTFFAHGGASGISYDETTKTVTINFPATGAALLTPVTQTNLTSLLGKPVTGNPLKTIINTDQYIGAVSWHYKPNQGNWTPETGGFFAPGTKYKATIKLTLFPGYTLEGVAPFAHGASGASVDYTLGSTTVTVTFAKTEEVTASVTITDYSLEHYVPIPVKGHYPVTSVYRTELTADIQWHVGTAETDPVMSTLTFATETVYTAVITLEAEQGYEFNKNFSYTGNTTSNQVQDSGNTDNKSRRTVTVTYMATEYFTVTIMDLATYLPRPKNGETPIPSFTTSEYAGTVQWKQGSGSATSFTGPFVGLSGGGPGDPGYIAVITLRTLPGYKFPASNFTYTPTPGSLVASDGIAVSGMNPDNTQCMVTLTFLRSLTPPTTIASLELKDALPQPQIGRTPITSFTTSEYAGTVQWKKASGESFTGPFVSHSGSDEAGYIAEITLRALPGYQFASDSSVFTYSRSNSLVTNNGIVVSAMNLDNTQCMVTLTFLRSLTP